MKLGRLNHVGVATPSIENSLALYKAMFGAEPHGPAFDLPVQGVRVCFVDAPNAQIELIEPLGADSPIARAGRAAHRRARDIGVLRPPQGHGRGADRVHGNAEGVEKNLTRRREAEK